MENGLSKFIALVLLGASIATIVLSGMAWGANNDNKSALGLFVVSWVLLVCAGIVTYQVFKNDLAIFKSTIESAISMTGMGMESMGMEY